MPDTEWHWDQGTKYAIEAIKALLLISGGAAVALLAFAGQISKSGVDVASQLRCSLLCFGFGVAFATLAFVFAYETQLQYGNYEHYKAKGDEKQSDKMHAWAGRLHNVTRVWMLISISFFLVGIWFAGGSILVGLK